MDPSQLAALTAAGWQLAGWLLTLSLPILIVQGVKLIRAHTAGTQWQAVERVVESSVRAANQYLSTQDGQTKKAWVLGVAQTWMNAHGIHLNAAALDAQIESAVLNEKTWGSEVAKVAISPNTVGADDLSKLGLPPADAPKG